MKNILIVAILVALSGCTSLGRLDAWNDMGPTGRSVGTILRTMDSTCKRLSGQGCDKTNFNTSNANLMMGQVKNLPYQLKSAPLPTKVAETLNVVK